MTKMQTLETDPAGDTSRLEQAAVPPRYTTNSDATQNRTLYVLGFGVLGAILANTIVLIYVASFYGPG
jgi:hypothetical protein